MAKYALLQIVAAFLLSWAPQHIDGEYHQTKPQIQNGWPFGGPEQLGTYLYKKKSIVNGRLKK